MFLDVKKTGALFAAIALCLGIIHAIISLSPHPNIPMPPAAEKYLISTAIVYPMILSVVIAIMCLVSKKNDSKFFKRLAVGLLPIAIITFLFRLMIVGLAHMDCSDNCADIPFTPAQENTITLYIFISYVMVFALILLFYMRLPKQNNLITGKTK
jgi:hypothetical protein